MITSKWKIIFMICLIMIPASLFAESTAHFQANNYERMGTAEDFQNVLSSQTVFFLYVSGCQLDNEALPAYQELCKTFPASSFIEIDQHSAAKDFMLSRFGLFGAPKVIAFYRGEMLSHMRPLVRQGNQADWHNSILQWGQTIEPVMQGLAKRKNISAASSYSYRKIMQGKRIILLRTNSADKDFKETMNILLSLAAFFPKIELVYTSFCKLIDCSLT